MPDPQTQVPQMTRLVILVMVPRLVVVCICLLYLKLIRNASKKWGPIFWPPSLKVVGWLRANSGKRGDPWCAVLELVVSFG